MVLAFISGLGVAFSGHDQAKHLMESQPMKMAASEALWKDSGDPAAWTLFANIDTDKKRKLCGDQYSVCFKLLGLFEV